MADEFQLQTRGVGVEVFLNNSTMLKGRLFLHVAAENHGGAEKVEDVLNAPRSFLPMAIREGGERTILVNKSQILFVRVPADPGRTGPDSGGVPSWAVQVTIELVQGAPLHGVLHFAQPPGRDRTLDGLNESERFLCLTQETAFSYINLRSIVVVREKGPHFESIPPPAP